MCRELSATGVREPEFRLVAFIMKATVIANILAEEQGETTQTTTPTDVMQKISPVQKEILVLIKDNAYTSRSEIIQKLGKIMEDGVKYSLKVLQQKGLLRRVGADFGGHWELIGNLNFIRDEKK